LACTPERTDINYPLRGGLIPGERQTNTDYKKGDVVVALENVGYWHGASVANKMVDIAITNY